MKRKITPQGLIVAALAGSVVCLAGVDRASADGFGNDTQSCAADRPCFNGVFQSGSKVIFHFTGITDWEFYNVRYDVGGGQARQVENRSGSFTFTDTQPDRIYKLSVQGCNAHAFSRSTCSPWSEASFTTAPPPAPAPPPEPGKTLGRVNPGGYYRLQLKQGGKYLDAVNCSSEVALNAGSTYAAGACQLWRFVPAGDGWNRLQLKQGGTYLDASYCSDKVVLGGSSTYAAGACQLWRFVPAGDGWSRLQLKQGGKYLDAVNCSDSVALNAGSTYANGACQLWRIVRETL